MSLSKEVIEQIQKIVKIEVDIILSPVLKITEENTRAINELIKRVDELAKRTDENSRAINELIKRVDELAKRTDENSRAINELIKITKENIVTIKRLQEVTGGLGRSIGFLVENEIRRSFKSYLIKEGFTIISFSPHKILGKHVFDLFSEVEKNGKRIIILGEIKQTLTPLKLNKFIENVRKIPETIENLELVILFNKVKNYKDVIKLAKENDIILFIYQGDDEFITFGTRHLRI